MMMMSNHDQVHHGTMMMSNMSTKSSQFVSDLAQFYRNKGHSGVTPSQLVARLNGQEVNLWDLYSAVLDMGGSYRVNQLSQWDQVYAKIFRKPPIGVNVSVALRQVYQRYLIAYERANTSNFNAEMMDEDDDGHDTMSKNSFLKDLSSQSFNCTLNSSFGSTSGLNVSMSNNSMYQPSFGTSYVQQPEKESFVNPLNKLYCSLVSGLPNEVEFGLKVTSMLANSKQIDWIADYKFIEVLLESTSLYVCNCHRREEEEGLGRFVGVSREDWEDVGSEKVVKVSSNNHPYRRRSTPTKTTPTRRKVPSGNTLDSEDVVSKSNHDNNSDHSRLGVPMVIDLVSTESPSKIIEKRLSIMSPKNRRSGGKSWSQSGLKSSSIKRKPCRCLQTFWNQICCDEPKVLSAVFEEPLRESDLGEIVSRTCDMEVSNIDESKAKIKRIAVIIRAITEFMKESAIASSGDGSSESTLIGSNLASAGSNLGLDPAPLSLIRFIALLISSKDSSLTNIGLDIMSNVALSPIDLSSYSSLSSNHFALKEDQSTASREKVSIETTNKLKGNCSLDYYSILSSYIYHECISNVLCCIDIDFVSKCLDILTCLNSGSILDDTSFTFFNSLLDQRFFDRLLELLTCQHDVPLLLSTLEFCLSISVSNPKLLLVHKTRSFLKILLTLLNCETSNYFTPAALSKIRITDFRIRIKDSRTNVHLMTSPNQLSRHQLVPQGQQQNQQITLQLVQQPQQPIIDNEALAVNWLQTNFESVPINGTKGQLILAEIYQEYVKFSVRNGRRNVLQGPSFNCVIRKVFPASVIHETTIEGITLKNSQLVTVTVPTVPVNVGGHTPGNIVVGHHQPGVIVGGQQQQQVVPPLVVNTNIPPVKPSGNPLTSPILKAHLSAPPKTLSPTGTSGQQQQSVPTVPVTTTSTSTLIKSLLATKLQNKTTSGAVQNIAAKLDSVASAPIIVPSQPIVSSVSTSKVTPIQPMIVQPSCTVVPNSVVTSPVVVTSSISTAPTMATIVPKVEPVVDQKQQQQPVVTNHVLQQPIQTVPQQIQPAVQQQQAVVTVSQPTQLPTQQTIMTVQSSSGPQQVLISTSNVTTGQPQQVLISTTAGGQRPGQPGQQQFILVRTVNPQGGVGGQVRLILPASVLTQQRPVPPTVNINGGTVAMVASGQSCGTTTQNVTTPAQNQPQQSSNDQLLKAVLGSSTTTEDNSKIVPNTSLNTSGNSNQVKSSPLLNVLLDKGKLPSPPVPSGTTSNVTSPPQGQAQQGQKMYILTTKQGVPIQTVQSTNQPGADNQNSISAGQPPMIQNGPIGKVEVLSIDPKLVVSNVNSGQCSSVPQQIVNCVQLTNGDVSSVLSEKSEPKSDLSPIKDIQKTVDEGSKIMKRKDSIGSKNNSIVPITKKVKLETVPSSGNIINTSCTSKTIGTVGAFGTVNCTTNNPVSPMNGGTGTIQVHVSNNSSEVKSESSSTIVSKSSQPITVSAAKAAAAASKAISKVSPPLKPKVTPTKNLAPKKVVSPPKAEVVVAPPTAPAPIVIEYRCEWTNCNRSFSKSSQVFKHVHDDHVFVETASKLTHMSCEWTGIHGMGPGCQSKRPKLSLLTHIQDFHCNEAHLKQAWIKRQSGATSTTSTAAAPVQVVPQIPPAHPGYAQNAALLAIRRHAVNYVEIPKIAPITATTPITVSIRLTAALILRNLCQVSSDVKKYLKRHERYLMELCAMDGRDESRTVAQCLALIQGSKK